MVKSEQVGIETAACYVRHTPKDKQAKASVHEVKSIGHKIKNGQIKLPPSKPQQTMITIPQSDVIEKLYPLIKRVKEQSKRHPGTVSLTELGFIAHELKQLADAWVKDGSESAARSDPVSHVSVRQRK
jgi:hypothetical protein